MRSRSCHIVGTERGRVSARGVARRRLPDLRVAQGAPVEREPAPQQREAAGRAALLRARALRAKAAALRRLLLLLPAKVVLRLLESTALRETRLATGHHWVACPIGPMPLLLVTANQQRLFFVPLPLP